MADSPEIRDRVMNANSRNLVGGVSRAGRARDVQSQRPHR